MPKTYVSPTPTPITPAQFIGPLSQKEKSAREKHSHHLNQTCSLIDHVFGNVIEAQTQEQFNHFQNPIHLVNAYSEQIAQHVERRVIFFLQQLVVCYGTRLHFEIGPTMDQAESAKQLDLKFRNRKLKLSVRNAAHSSTFPCLIAYSGEEWAKYTQKQAPEPKSFVFLKGSDLYHISNATIDMPRAVNDADIQLDGSHHDSSFSRHALSLLNQASYGQVDPETAIQLFVEKSIQFIKQKLPAVENMGAKRALELYLEKLRDIQALIQHDDNWIYSHLDVPDPQTRLVEMKSMILRIRCSSIRKNRQGQAEMAAKIDAVRAQIFQEFNRKPAVIEDAFRHLIIQEMPTVQDKERMKKFFTIPPETYNLRATTGRMSRLESAKAKLANKMDMIRHLAHDLKRHMYHMRVEEEQQRGDSLRAIRFAKKWTQQDLSRQLKTHFPEEPSSQSTICRCEKGERLINLTLAHKLSHVLGIPNGLLVTQFFND